MKKKFIIGAAALAATGALVLALTGAAGAGTQGIAVRTATLQQGTLSQTVSATGTVYSEQSTEVYSNLNYPIKTVYVAVGDKVAQGDVLAELDMSGLELDIAQKQASIWASQQTANQNLAVAQKDLETYQKNLDGSYDSSVLSAQSSVTTAEFDIQTAELDVQTAGNDVRSARQNLQDARNGDGDYEEMEASDAQLQTLKDTLYAKETALEKAQANLERAQANLEKAKQSLDATNVSSEDALKTYEDKVTSAQLGTNFNDQYISVQKLQADLEKGIITAPVSGTVTAVTAVAGGSGSGQLFVLQETDSLKVVTNIKEYDIDQVTVGDKVLIKADATGEQEFTGSLSKIAPTSSQTADGSKTSSTDAEYESEVLVTDQQTGLRVGMNVRLNVITQERESTYAVPYEAVGANEAGESVVYAVIEQEDGLLTAQEIAVTTGMETDLHVEILSEQLADGMEIIKNASGIIDGAAVTTDIPESRGASRG